MQREQTETQKTMTRSLSSIRDSRFSQNPSGYVTLAMSTPVNDFTSSGTRVTILNTSEVNFSAPIVPSPLETIVIFFAWDRGAATSAAT